jgi:hypothetical protein
MEHARGVHMHVNGLFVPNIIVILMAGSLNIIADFNGRKSHYRAESLFFISFHCATGVPLNNI